MPPFSVTSLGRKRVPKGGKPQGRARITGLSKKHRPAPVDLYPGGPPRGAFVKNKTTCWKRKKAVGPKGKLIFVVAFFVWGPVLDGGNCLSGSLFFSTGGGAPPVERSHKIIPPPLSDPGGYPPKTMRFTPPPLIFPHDVLSIAEIKLLTLKQFL